MLNEKVMFDTVSRLIEAGIDEATIVSTLADAGLSNEEALAEVAKVKAAKAVSQQNTAPPQQAAPQDLALLKTQLETQAEQHDLHQLTTSNILDDHEEKIADIASKVEEVKATISSPQTTDPALSYRISELEKKVEEINAATKACLDVLGKILENNRKILTDLEAEK